MEVRGPTEVAEESSEVNRDEESSQMPKSQLH